MGYIVAGEGAQRAIAQAGSNAVSAAAEKAQPAKTPAKNRTDATAVQSHKSTSGAIASGTKSNPVDPSKPMNSIEGAVTDMRSGEGSSGELERDLGVPNPTESGFMIQEINKTNLQGRESIQDHLIGDVPHFWEAFPVRVDGDGFVTYPQGQRDTFQTADLSTNFGPATTSTVTSKAIYMPGYTLNPADGWRVGGNGSSGDLMMTTTRPTGWPTSFGSRNRGGTPATSSFTVKLRARNGVRTVTIETPGRTTITKVLPPIPPHP